MASEKLYRRVAQIFLGRPARSQAELDLMDFKLRGFLSAPRMTGFGTKYFWKFCLPINRPFNEFPMNLLQVTCFGLFGSRGTDLKPVGEYIWLKSISTLNKKNKPTISNISARGVDSINWTDNENTVLITPCAGEDFNWLVLSRRPTISDEAKNKIIQRITALGFNANNANYYDYENKRFLKHHKTLPGVVHEPDVSVQPYSFKSYLHKTEDVSSPSEFSTALNSPF
jgi:hypothetical protein